jgi:hypothetical protein
VINLKGFAVGNGCTDVTECQFDSVDEENAYPRYQLQLFNDIGILSDSDFEEVKRICNDTQKLSDLCKNKLEEVR